MDQGPRLKLQGFSLLYTLLLTLGNSIVFPSHHLSYSCPVSGLVSLVYSVSCSNPPSPPLGPLPSPRFMDKVKAALELGGERSEVEVGDGQLLSEKLVQLKRLCMERLALYLLRDNPTAGQDPLDASDNEDDENSDSLADDDTNSNPPLPKKRK